MHININFKINILNRGLFVATKSGVLHIRTL